MPHSPTHLREALLQYLDDGDQPLDGKVSGQLWNCTDTLPGDYCVELDLPRGSTYAMAVRELARIAHTNSN